MEPFGCFFDLDFTEALFGFGFVESLTIYAVRDGFANDPGTWLFGVVPFAGCSIVIPVGITVIWARPALTFPLEKIEIFGNLGFGSGSSSFKFDFPVKINCRSGGQIRDLTSSKLFILAESSLIIVRPGGSFAAAGTVIQISSPSGPGNSTTVDSASGPFTCAALGGGVIVSYKSVAFIVVQSGNVLSSSSYLNDEAPSAEACDSGCAIYISSGVALSTAGLSGGVLNFKIAQIDVPSGATFDVGEAGSNDGLKCLFPIEINVRGTFGYRSSGGKISIPSGNGDSSGINFFAGGKISSTVIVFIQVYNIITGVDIGPPLECPSDLVGPFFILIVIDGTFVINVIGIKRFSTATVEIYAILFRFRSWRSSVNEQNHCSY